MKNKRRSTVISSKKNRGIIFKTIAVLVFIYLTIQVIMGNRGLINYFDRKRTIVNIRKEIKTLTKQNAEINEEIDLFKNDKDFFLLEQKARDFGLTMQGELIYKYKIE